MTMALFYIFLQTASEIPSVIRYGEKITLLGVLAIIVYVLYKRDMAKEKQFAELQEKIFELEKSHLAVMEDMKDAINRNTLAMEKMLQNAVSAK